MSARIDAGRSPTVEVMALLLPMIRAEVARLVDGGWRLGSVALLLLEPDPLQDIQAIEDARARARALRSDLAGLDLDAGPDAQETLRAALETLERIQGRVWSLLAVAFADGRALLHVPRGSAAETELLRLYPGLDLERSERRPAALLGSWDARIPGEDGASLLLRVLLHGADEALEELAAALEREIGDPPNEDDDTELLAGLLDADADRCVHCYRIQVPDDGPFCATCGLAPWNPADGALCVLCAGAGCEACHGAGRIPTPTPTP